VSDFAQVSIPFTKMGEKCGDSRTPKPSGRNPMTNKKELSKRIAGQNVYSILA